MTTTKSRAAHPNRIPFEGVLTRVDQPSDGSPKGADGRLVLLTRAAAEEALDTLIGMGVSFNDNWKLHDRRRKCGVITHAFIVGDELKIKGYVYGRDFPEVTEQLRKPEVKMGMSYEMVDAHVADMRKPVLVLTKVTFTGAAILLQHKGAYKTSRINLEASAARFTRSLPGQLSRISISRSCRRHPRS